MAVTVDAPTFAASAPDTLARPSPRTPDAPSGRAEAVARLLAFTALGLFAAHAWGQLVDPPVGRHLTACVLIALAVAAAGTLMAHRAPLGHGRRRLAVATGVLAAVALTLLACGVPAQLLWVKHLDRLAQGLGDGLTALPDVRVPYRGEQEWVRIIMRIGGGLLLLGAAGLVAGRTGRPLAATAVLTVLYAVPVVETGQPHPFRSGAVFAALAAWLALGTRVPRAQGATAVAVGAIALTAALVIAPRIDGAKPLIDYQHLGDRFKDAPRTLFQWDHTYEPLDWPRTGQELLRVKSDHPAYWKGLTLETFDGLRWLNSGQVAPGRPDTEIARHHQGWLTRVTVTVGELQSQQLYAPGQILQIVRSSIRTQRASGGGVQTARRLLTRGDSYVADVYAPRPTRGQLRTAGVDYPSFVRSALLVDVPALVGGPKTLNPSSGKPDPDTSTAVSILPYGVSGRPRRLSTTGAVYADGDKLLAASDYRRTWALARHLRAISTSPYDLVRRVQRRVRQGAVYDERPPAARVPLESFLFDVRRGYCQQFSGAMALLLRMAGVPARVAAGFAPGRHDGSRDEYAISDLDAHSWVEVYFPKIGWVTFDPTPATAPPVSQEDLAGPRAGAQAARPADAGGLGGRARAPRSGAGPRSDSGAHPWLVFGLVLLAAAAVQSVRSLRRRRQARRARDLAAGPDLAELLRALRLTQRTVPGGATLAQLEQRFAASPDARRYLAAVGRVRYAGGPGPGPADRRALRRALAEGLGLVGHLRAFRALPPSAGRLVDPRAALGGLAARRDRRSRSYT